ncbi:MAG: hypothetical protein MJ191_05700 [Clostridium sp.]|nr:hypothetical protein [Clostridium sp.]
MRKKTINKICDSFMWYLLYLLPVIIFIVSSINDSGSITSFKNVMDIFGVSETSIIYISLSELIGYGGILESFIDSSMILYFSYFIMVNIAHVIVDVVVFLPRLCHKYMSYFYQDKE